MNKLVVGLLAIWLAFASPAYAANVNIDGLPAASSVNSGDLIECEQSGVNNKCTPAQIKTFLNPITSVGGGCGTATSPSPITSGSGTVGASVTNRAVTGTTDTILAADCGNVITYNSASAVAASQPAPSGSFAAGFFVQVCNKNSGPVTFTPGSGTIYGGSTFVLPAGSATAPSCAAWQSDGTNFNPLVGGIIPGTLVPNIVGSVTTQSGTTYTFASTDCGTTVRFSNASAVTATIPQGLPVGCVIAVEQAGAGQVAVNGSAVTPATLHSAHSYTKTSGQWAMINLFTESSNVAVLTGDGA